MIPKIASEAGCDLAMLDTAVKDGKNLTEFMNNKQLKSFVDEAHTYGLKAALAGSLKMENLPILCAVGVDVIGVRSAACTNGNRVTGHITKDKVKAISQIIKNAEKPCRFSDT
jgi:uncharacterized protein (UPF0264 family)